VLSPAASLKNGRIPNPLTILSSHLLFFYLLTFLTSHLPSFPPSALLPELVKNLLGRLDGGIDVLIIVGCGKKEHFKLGRRYVYALLPHSLIKAGKKIEITGLGIFEIGYILIREKHPEHGADVPYPGCDTGLLGCIAKTGGQPLCTIV
jgi:hypothetical protein